MFKLANASSTGLRTVFSRQSYATWGRSLFRKSKTERAIEEQEKHGDVPPEPEETFKFYTDGLQKKERAIKSSDGYVPAVDVYQRIMKLCDNLLPPTSKKDDWLKTNISDIRLKYKLLEQCREEFDDHGVPNSQLHAMETVNDVVKFYETSETAITKFEELQRVPDLPPNLYIQPNPIRFHPDTDEKFDGVTAYPGRSTIITSLRAKKQGYKGHEQPKINPLERKVGPIG